MKNIFNYSLLIVCIGMLISCEDFLTEDPPTFISDTNFYQTEAQARSGCDAAYESLDNGSSTTSAYGFYWPMLDLGTDDVSSKLNQNQNIDWISHNVTSTEEWFTNRDQYAIWWEGISRANYAIEGIPKVTEMSDESKNSMIGEARALRALYYLHLVKTFGDLPIMLNYVSTESQIYVERESVENVFEKVIVPDLKFAEEHCPDELHAGRITKWTAKIILADAYLTHAGWRRTSQGEFVKGDPINWELARDKAKEIIDDSPHALNTEPEDDNLHTTPAYGIAWNTPFTKESMMELATLPEDGLGSRLSKGCGVTNHGRQYWGSGWDDQPLLAEGNTGTIRNLRFPGTPSTAGNYIPTPNLYKAFEADDIRGKWSLMTRYTDSEGNVYLTPPTFRKYVDIDYYLGVEGASEFRTNTNFILYRYADALLIYAEAANEVEGAPSALAYDAVNQIRKRAFEVTDNSKDFSSLSQDEFRKAVWLERRREFNGEVKRRFDLIRTNRLFTATDPSINNQMDRIWDAEEDSATEYTTLNVEYGSSAFPDHEWLMPIPQKDIELTGWTQNLGY